MDKRLGGRITARRSSFLVFLFVLLAVEVKVANFHTDHNLASMLNMNSEGSTQHRKQPRSNSPPVSVTMTTCNRLRLTEDSLRAFCQFNEDANIKVFKIVVDCYNSTFFDAISKEFPNVDVLRSKSNSNSPAQRVLDNVQLLYSHVLKEGTMYWVHLEDDWSFVKGKFITDAIKLFNSLGENSTTWQVIGREANTFQPRTNDTFGWKTTPDNITYSVLNILSGGGGQFGSFTLNDSVIRVAALKKWNVTFSQYNHEAVLSLTLGKKYGAQVAILKDFRYYHTGGNSSTMHA